MKKLTAIAILFVIVFSACNPIVAVFQPIVGTWEATGVFGTTRMVYNGNSTCTEINTLLSVSISRSGTWDSDSDKITRTWDDASTDVNYYSFSENNSEMMLSSDPIGISIVYTRQ